MVSTASVLLLSGSLFLAGTASAAGVEPPAVSSAPVSESRRVGYEAWEQAMRGEHRQAIAGFERALELGRRDPDLRHESALQAAMGSSLVAIGELRRAEEPLTRAVELHRRLGIYDYVVLDLLARTHHELGDFVSAKERYEEAAVLARRQGERADEAAAAANLGRARLLLNDYGGAEDAFLSAIRLFRLLGEKRLAALVFLELAYLQYRLGDAYKTMRAAELSLMLQREAGTREGETAALIYYGSALEAIGEEERALKFYERALSLSEGDPKNRSSEASALASIGRLRFDRGEDQAAVEALSESLAKYETMEGDETAEMNIRLAANHLAGVHLHFGRLDEARALIARYDLNPSRAELYRRTGDFPRAVREYGKALVQARELRDAPTLIETSIGVALATEAQGDIRGARELFESAIGELEKQRERLPLAQRGRFLQGRTMWFRRMDAYQGRIRTAVGPADAFFWAESAKARNFVDSISTRGAAGILPAANRQEETRLESALRELRARDDAAFTRRDRAAMDRLRPELRAAELRLAQLVARLRREAPAYAAVNYPQPWDAEDIPLREGEVLVEYAVDDGTGTILILPHGRPAAATALRASRARLESLVLAFRARLDDPYDGLRRFKPRFDDSAAAELYDLLLRPALAARGEDGELLISSTSRLIIVPDGPLGGLPFEALLAGPAGPRYAGDGLDIAYAQSATALGVARSLRKGRAGGRGLFVLADPVFAPCDPRAPSTWPARSDLEVERDRVVVNTIGTNEDCPRLEETGRLAARLSEVFGAEAAPPLMGLEATIERLERARLSRYRYLVFATHGYLAGDRPYLREPALMLTRDMDGSDSFLSMSRVMAMELDADLVALTACNTGMGIRVEGEGTLGMGRAFQHAGARNVLMSLWRVEEKSTTTLIEGVLRRVKSGAPVREALRAARADIRAAGYDHPFYWAPFVLMAE